MDRLRYDSAMFWLALGTAAAVIGLALMTIGVTRMPANANLLGSGWFDGGLGVLAIGAGFLLWALWLFLGRRRTVSQPPAQPGAAASANPEAEAVKAYYREREKLMDKAMEVWERQQKDRRSKG